METELSFGSWIRRRRKALDLLQKDLADQVGCSVSALQKIELDERRPSRQLAERLAASLDVLPDERAAFVQIARGERLVEQLDNRPPPGPRCQFRQRRWLAGMWSSPRSRACWRLRTASC